VLLCKPAALSSTSALAVAGEDEIFTESSTSW